MTNREKKNILMSYRRYKQKAEALNAELNALVSPKSLPLTGMPSSGAQHDLSDVMIRAEKILARLNNTLSKQYAALDLIDTEIEKMDNQNEKTLLTLHYIAGYNLKKTARKMTYSYDHVCHLHGSALAHFMKDDKSEQF